MTVILLNVTTLAALLVPLLYLGTNRERLNQVFVLLLCGSVAATVGFTAHLSLFHDVSSFTLAIWGCLSSTLLLFGLFSTWKPALLRFSPLILGFALWMAAWGTVWTYHPSHAITHLAWSGHGLALHITFATLAYGFATLAAIAAFAAFWVERGLKQKKPTNLSRFLPAILESEATLFYFLSWAFAALCLGFLSGATLNYLYFDYLIIWDHKTIFSMASLAAIGILLLAHHGVGLRGRHATRLVLLAYLFINLGFLGVKFATNIVFS